VVGVVVGGVWVLGVVVGWGWGDAHAAGKRFQLRDVKGTKTVTVVYKGSVPDLFKTGRDVVVDGRMRNGVFVAVPDTLVTKCPSKYAPKR
jgi:cytochrome c-type biogenesis protein CcmE